MQLRVPDLVTSANQQIELVCQSSKFFSLGRFFVCSAQIFFLELLKTLLPRFYFLIMQCLETRQQHPRRTVRCFYESVRLFHIVRTIIQYLAVIPRPVQICTQRIRLQDCTIIQCAMCCDGGYFNHIFFPVFSASPLTNSA